jgi:hypothetical protein
MYIRKNIIWIAKLVLIWLLAFAGSSMPASEDEGAGRHQYRGVRAMGMGNAFAAVADDGDAFYYNPAGLVAVRKIRVDLQPVKFTLTQDFYDEFKDRDELMSDIEAISESTEPLGDDLEDERRRLMQRMKCLMHENLGLDVASPVRVVVPLHIGDCGVAIGGMAHAWSGSQIHVRRRGLNWSDFVKDMLDDEIVYNIMAEASYGVATAIEVPVRPLPLELSIGLAARRIRRWQMADEDDPLGMEELLNPYGKDGIKGTADDFEKRYFDPEDPLASVSETKGYNVDAGTIASFGDAVNLAVVLQNLVGKIKDDELPKDLQVSAAVNLARLPSPDIPTLDVILAAGLDNLDEGWERDQIVDTARLGLELVWKLPLLAISGRIGSNHGYITLGAGIQLMFLDFDYAFYGDQDANWHALSLNLTF